MTGSCLCSDTFHLGVFLTDAGENKVVKVVIKTKNKRRNYC